MVPNKNGNFMKSEDIYVYKDDNRILKIINHIYNKIFDKELNNIIMNEKIEISNLEKTIKTKSLKEIFNEFSNFLKENNDVNKKEYLVNELISFSIDNIKINKMFKIMTESDDRYINKKREEFQKNENKHNIWREVEDLWYDYHSKVIESKENISNLSKTLSRANIQKQPLIWINEYIQFLKDNSTITEKKKIFPNQNGNFSFIKELRYENSIPDFLKDIYNSLMSENNSNYDIRNYLLSKDIISYKGYDKLTEKELIEKIEELFKRKDQNIKLSISEKIITLLPLNEGTKFETINNALNELIQYYNDLLNKNLIPIETNTKTEINYELFIDFILDKLFKDIEEMKSNQIISKIEIIPKLIKFSWNYQFHENLKLSINPNNYKIFVNQNYELKEIDKIFIKEDFGDFKYTDTEQKLFELSNSKIINMNYKDIFLETNFDKILSKYNYQFKSLKLIDICNIKIDYAIFNYFQDNKEKKLDEKNYEEFRKIFFSLNRLLKQNPSLKPNFPKFMKERGNISMKLLEFKNDEMEHVIEYVEKSYNP